MDPETVSPPSDVDLDAVAADLVAVELALDELAAGTYLHDGPSPTSTTDPALAEPPAS